MYRHVGRLFIVNVLIYSSFQCMHGLIDFTVPMDLSNYCSKIVHCHQWILFFFLSCFDYAAFASLIYMLMVVVLVSRFSCNAFFFVIDFDIVLAHNPICFYRWELLLVLGWLHLLMLWFLQATQGWIPLKLLSSRFLRSSSWNDPLDYIQVWCWFTSICYKYKNFRCWTFLPKLTRVLWKLSPLWNSLGRVRRLGLLRLHCSRSLR